MRRILAGTAMALALTAVTTGCGVGLDAKEVHATEAFPLTGIQLTIKSSLGGVRVLPGTGTSIEVERWTRGKASNSPTWSLRDGTLRLSAHCTIVFGDCGARYHVRVPPTVRLTVETGDDGVILKDLTQDVDVVSRGRIQVSGTSGRLRLRGEDSPITGDGLKSGGVRARTLSGLIDLAFVTPPADLDLQSRDGGVTATVPRGSYKVTARSTDGTARSELESAEDGDRTIVARSTTGHVRVRAAK
ncbi:DUF4097 family beta strand repeat protein [Nonomuraea sp. NN258]|uniref:DUF4097 family beta strand repeat-containing protein n=1 Tax=Nonomuraea antri TaxID=2730852 RepID=UPI0015682350|nr:DUF4097 family beta strand repeat-containing protein [Nonomuraea antri]NRQ36918.1 DUF4097 family beta strand repeat protein [Nonomuraea antri]